MNEGEAIERKSKKKDNQLNNSVPKKEIDGLIERIFTQRWDPKAKSKGPKRLYNPGRSVPYVIKKDGHFWLNPHVFSWTKKDDAGQPAGYATVVVGSKQVMDAAIARAAVHVLVWRWANGYAEVAEGLQVSHLTDQPTLITPSTLVVEDGVTNRARVACIRNGWHKEYRKGVLRCPHEKVCIEPMALPTEAEFLDGVPPGLPNVE